MFEQREGREEGGVLAGDGGREEGGEVRRERCLSKGG